MSSKKMKASRNEWRTRAIDGAIRLMAVRKATDNFEAVWFTPSDQHDTMVAVGELLSTLDALLRQEN